MAAKITAARKIFLNLRESEPVKKPDEMIREMETDSRRMVRYLSSINKEVPETVLKKLSSLSVFISDYENGKSEGKEKDITSDMWQDKLAMAHDIFNKLSILSKPANSVSIKYTEFTSGFLLKNNPVVNYLIFFTVIFLVIYIVLNIIDGIPDSVKDPLLIITASGLGAEFCWQGGPTVLDSVSPRRVNRSG